MAWEGADELVVALFHRSLELEDLLLAMVDELGESDDVFTLWTELPNPSEAHARPQTKYPLRKLKALVTGCIPRLVESVGKVPLISACFLPLKHGF